MQKWFVILIAAVAALAVVAGCAETPAEQPPTPASSTPVVKLTTVPHTTMPAATTIAPSPALTISTITVTITDDTFSPADVTVKVGSQVRWVNNDDHPHRVKFTNDAFTAFLLGSSQSFSQQFDRTGVYDYTCAIVPSMHGKVTVVA